MSACLVHAVVKEEDVTEECFMALVNSSERSLPDHGISSRREDKAVETLLQPSLPPVFTAQGVA